MNKNHGFACPYCLRHVTPGQRPQKLETLEMDRCHWTWLHEHVASQSCGARLQKGRRLGWRVWGCHLEILTDFIPDFVSISAVPWDSGACARGLKPQFRSSPAPTPAWQGALLPAVQPPPRNSCCPEDRLWEGQAPASVHWDSGTQTPVKGQGSLPE